LRQSAHLRGYIKEVATCGKRTPALQHSGGQLAHHGNPWGKPLGLKGGLHETALTAPELALTGGQPVSEKWPNSFNYETFAVISGIVLQDVFDVIWMAEQVDTAGPWAQLHYIAILTCSIKQILQGILPHLRQNADNRKAARTGWEVASIGVYHLSPSYA
jgi:hypothetical protein